MARSIAQDAASMNAALDGIWRMGDRDECSIKHIGHATAALAAGKGWAEGVDYSTPWAGDEDWLNLEAYNRLYPNGRDGVQIFEDWAIIPWVEQRKQMQYAQLGKRWAKVQAKRDEWGTERFDQVMQATKFAWYHTQNLELYWTEEVRHDISG